MSTESNIYKSLRLNRIIVFAVIFLALASIIASIVFAFITYKYNMKHALVLSADGEVIPLELVERNRVINIQIQEHLRYFYGSYYTFDQNSMPGQREKGLWLVDDVTGRQLEDFYEGQGWFNKIIRESLEQKTTIIEESVQIAGTNAPYSFQLTVEIVVNPMSRKDLITTYRMNVVGQISLVQAAWPVNTEGLLIHSYRESPWSKLEPQ